MPIEGMDELYGKKRVEEQIESGVLPKKFKNRDTDGAEEGLGEEVEGVEGESEIDDEKEARKPSYERKTALLHDNQIIDTVVNKTLLGRGIKDIAKDLKVTPLTVSNLKNTPAFRHKWEMVINRQRELAMEPFRRMEGMKDKLVGEALDLAFNGSEKVRAMMVTWCLERFPEFATKNIPNMGGNTAERSLSSDDADRIEKASKKLTSIVGILKQGNPNVVTFREIKVEEKSQNDSTDRLPTDESDGNSAA